MRACWCGNTRFLPFSAEYGKCNNCYTLVSLQSLSDEQLIVQDDDKDFYGKQYWLGHQQQDLGFPDIYVRSRNDLRERNLHWLKTLLKYALPPTKVLELGCSHGSFVALMSHAGYQSMGVEMSPWVVDFGRKSFEIPVYIGPIESLDIPQKSLDVIALMDVLEHLPNPIVTMRHCVDLLKPDGFLLIQTPEFQEDMDYESLIIENSPFLEQLKADEHLYLFNRNSVAELLARIGVNHIYFEPAIFSQYDMFFVASKAALNSYSFDEASKALQRTSGGRMALALLDIRESEITQIQKLRASENDRSARLEKMHILTQQLDKMKSSNLKLKDTNSLLKNTLADNNDLLESRLSKKTVEFDSNLDILNAELSKLKSQLSNPLVRALLTLIRVFNRIFRKI